MANPVKYHYGKFPPENLDWKRLNKLVGQANSALGRYDGLLYAIPNVDVLLSPLITQEAVLSSKIEGTNVTMGEVLEIQAGGDSKNISQSKKDDSEEVINYRYALMKSANETRDRPISQHLIRQAHSILMQGVRGRDKLPGQYRNDQNWIGEHGCPIEEASFIPISPEQLVPGMDNLEKYINSSHDIDLLLKLAIIHVEFEALHPFRDGNGRLGRMLIPLFLYEKKLLSSPNFYLSSYLEKNREVYVETLRAVSSKDDWTGWCEFFIQGICEQSQENEKKARLILALYDNIKGKIVNVTHSQHAIKALDYIYENPIFSGKDFSDKSNIPKPTAARILTILKDEEIVKIIRESSGRRPALYVFPDLLNFAEGKGIF